MRGEAVKDKLLSNGYILSDIAQTMGVSPQALHKLLIVDDIKTGVLERIATAINKDFSFFFSTNDPVEVEITNSIISNIRKVRYLYQRIVDVNILITEHLNIEEETDYVGEAAETMNNLILTEHGLTQWKDFDINEKKFYNQKLKDAVRLLEEMFFERFKLLYKTIRKIELL